MTKIKGFPKDVEETRTIPFVFSDETRDSYGTVFSVKGWELDRFNKNGIALFNHNSYSSDPDMSIGHARAWVEGKRLLGEITFESAELNPIADKVFRKFLNGTYKGVSIRFWPLENGRFGDGDESPEGKCPTYYIGKRELIEISAAPIPSNKNALVRSLGKELEEKPAEGEGFFAFGSIRSVEENEGDVQTQIENTSTEDTQSDNFPPKSETPAVDNDTDERFFNSYVDGIRAMADV